MVCGKFLFGQRGRHTSVVMILKYLRCLGQWEDMWVNTHVADDLTSWGFGVIEVTWVLKVKGAEHLGKTRKGDGL